MKKLSIAILSVLLGACASVSAGPQSKLVAEVKTEIYDAKFYDSQCSSKRVLALTGPVAEVVKNGSVTFTDGTPKREFCYIIVEESENGSIAFMIDEEGEQGAVELKK